MVVLRSPTSCLAAKKENAKKMKTFTIYKIYDKGLPSERKAIAREGFTDETEVTAEGADLVTDETSGEE